MENEENAVEETQETKETPAPETKSAPKKAAPKTQKTTIVTAPTPATASEDETDQRLAALETEREVERVRAENAENTVHAYRVRDAIVTALSEPGAGIRNASLVGDLVKADKIKFVTDAKLGEVATGITEELARIKKAHPGLFYDVPGSADGGAGGDIAPAGDGNAWFRGLMR